MPPQAKAEALTALEHVKSMLDGPENGPGSLDGLARRLAVATLDYAMEQVAAIEELKRARRAPKN